MRRAIAVTVAALSVSLTLLAASATSAFAAAVPAPLAPLVLDPAAEPGAVRAIELERMLADLQAEQVSLTTRIQVAGVAIDEQGAALSRARSEQREAQDAFNVRAVAMYRFTGYDELALLLDARSWQDLVSRVTVIARILDTDRAALQEASVLAAQAEYEAAQLDALRSESDQLRGLLDQRVQLAQTALAEQDAVRETLTPAGMATYSAQREADARVRALWRSSSVPLGAVVGTATAKVTPYPAAFTVSDRSPRSFRSSGLAYTAMAAWYGPGFNGEPTASGRVYNQDDFSCASRTLPLGSWLALTRGTARIVVLVTDRGPYASGRDLDLSKAAADALGLDGTTPVQAEVVTPLP